MRWEVVASGLAAFAALFGWLTHRKVEASTLKIEAMHVQFNSRMDELMKLREEVVRIAAYTAGMEAGRKSRDPE